VIRRRICGDEIDFLIGDLFGEGWYGPHHDPWPELEWIKEHGIRPGNTVIDCGANHGFSTVLFSKWAGEKGKVYAFEPLPHNVGILKKNLQLNGVENAVLHDVAVGDTNACITLSDHPNAAITDQQSGHTITTAIRRLDDEITVSPIDFIKIDVEGYELKVLEGASRLLKTRPRLAVELHVCMYEQPLDALRQIFDLLEPMRYRMWIQPEVDGAIRPYDATSDSPARLRSREVVHLFCA
jgi:FkbM family methyltransferase